MKPSNHDSSHVGWIIQVVWDLSTLPVSSEERISFSSCPSFEAIIKKDDVDSLEVRTIYTSTVRTLTWSQAADAWLCKECNDLPVKVYFERRANPGTPEVPAYEDDDDPEGLAFVLRDMQMLREFADDNIYPYVTCRMLREALMEYRIDGVLEPEKDRELLKWMIDNKDNIEMTSETVFSVLFNSYLFDLVIYLHEELHVPIPDFDILDLDLSDIDLDIIRPMLIWLHSKKPLTADYISSLLENNLLEKQSENIKAWLTTFC